MHNNRTTSAQRVLFLVFTAVCSGALYLVHHSSMSDFNKGLATPLLVLGAFVWFILAIPSRDDPW